MIGLGNIVCSPYTSEGGLFVVILQSELGLFCKIEGKWEGAGYVDGPVLLYPVSLLCANAQLWFSRRQLQDEEIAYVKHTRGSVAMGFSNRRGNCSALTLTPFGLVFRLP